MLTGPDHHGPVPGDMLQVRLRTSRGVVAARIFVNGQADLPTPSRRKPASSSCPCPAISGTAWPTSTDPAFSEPSASQAPEELRFFEVLGQAIAERLSRRVDPMTPSSPRSCG